MLNIKRGSLFLCLGVLLCCNGRRVRYIDSSKLNGCWSLVSSDDVVYGTVNFADSVLELTSRADTLYRYIYYLKGHVLCLKDVLGDSVSAEIILLNKESLQFSYLIRKEGRQLYLRCK